MGAPAITPPSDWEPWHRLPGEGELPFALFQQFLAASVPRDLRAFGRRSGFAVSWATLETYAWEWEWSERARLWDAHLDHIRISTIERVTEQTAEEVAHRQLKLLVRMQMLADGEISKLLKISQESDVPGVVTARDAARLALIGVRLERLVRGEATEKIEQGPDMSKYSVEDLRQLRALQEKAGVR